MSELRTERVYTPSMFRRWVFVTFFGLLALGCGSSSGTRAYSENQERLHVAVTVTYVEGVELPPGSTVRAALVDVSDELKPALSSSAVATREGREGAVELEITYPRDQLDDSHEFMIQGEITAPDGTRLYVASEPVPIDTSRDETLRVDLRLTKAGT